MADGVIISHAEGYKRKIASNHGDPEHLWRGLGLNYTMDTFRHDVNRVLNGDVKTTEALAREVIRSLWGNGAERRKRLTAAGYNYRTVQDRVNEILR